MDVHLASTNETLCQFVSVSHPVDLVCVCVLDMVACPEIAAMAIYIATKLGEGVPSIFEMTAMQNILGLKPQDQIPPGVQLDVQPRLVDENHGYDLGSLDQHG